ncbi:hypothetical protein EYF80_035227 [Liparis tanakae]|uniref:Uncharacterized protein n=1 Tax=Liparis tanakae TaxID=230148 RepID=A0A4Z2GP37_9TELE|nr:hypothetical protein EYF80_035227 [Liparis tanakae]
MEQTLQAISLNLQSSNTRLDQHKQALVHHKEAEARQQKEATRQQAELAAQRERMVHQHTLLTSQRDIFHVTAAAVLAEGGPTASLSAVLAVVLLQLLGCDKERREEKFHTNYDTIMKHLDDDKDQEESHRQAAASSCEPHPPAEPQQRSSSRWGRASDAWLSRGSLCSGKRTMVAQPFQEQVLGVKTQHMVTAASSVALVLHG